MKNIKIGDKIRITETGAEYTTYKSFFKEQNLSNRLLEDFPNGDDRGLKTGEECIVLYKGSHIKSECGVLVLRRDNGKIALIAERGVKVISLICKEDLKVGMKVKLRDGAVCEIAFFKRDELNDWMLVGKNDRDKFFVLDKLDYTQSMEYSGDTKSDVIEIIK